jgi:hypothetical protein
MISFHSNILNKNYIHIIIISLFSFLINFYYSKFGSFPIDTFLHYDSAVRILNNEYPVRDYWIVSGIVVDLIQSIFFKILGVNWFAYTFHSSLFNLVISIATYYFFLSLGLNKINSLIYTLCFATLAYTISGTPFVDHHASFFLLLATYLIIHALKTPKKNYLWFFVVMLFFLSFLSKQVPFAYVFFSQSVILLYVFIKNKYFNIVKTIFISSAILTVFFLIFLSYLNINFNDFYIQYIEYPKSIGEKRYFSLNNSLESFFNQYKFLIFPIMIIFIIKCNKIMNNKLDLHSKEIISFLIILTLGASLILHQLLTKNQIYIYFLIPVFFALLESNLINLTKNLKKYCSFTIIIFLIVITFKYHLRYNETRKFHELENVNLKNSIKSEIIDPSLGGLFWLNPMYKNAPKNEILILKSAISRLEKTKPNIMFFTNYLFLDSITTKNLNNPNKCFTKDGTCFPIKGNKFYKNYKDFIKNKIKRKKIKKIYFFRHEKIDYQIIEEYLSQNCYSYDTDDLFHIYEINCLK